MNEVLEVVRLIADSIGEFHNLLGSLPWSGGGQSIIWLIELSVVAWIIKTLDSVGSKVKRDPVERSKQENPRS